LKGDAMPPLIQDSDVELVVFVLHGIRDWGHWTKDMADKITHKAAVAGVKAIPVKPSYNYFSMVSFLFWLKRWKNVRWFMDEYTGVVAKYPKARIGFVGHSNGTFILANALSRYSTTRFDRVALAGSVVPRAFPWDQFSDEKRVAGICNAIASADWVVAIFPRFFELFAELTGRSSEIGSGGYLGFLDNSAQANVIQYARGGHGTAIGQSYHEAIVDFLISGKLEIPKQLLVKKQSAWVSLMSKFCWVVWTILAGVVLGLGYLWMLWCWHVSFFGFPWFPAILFLAGFYLLLKTI